MNWNESPHPDDKKIVLAFATKLEEYVAEDDMKPERAVGEALKFCRDSLEVNAARALDRMNYMIDDGDESVYQFDFSFRDKDEDWFQLWDPVFPESEREGGTADIREGDEIVHTDAEGNTARATVERVGANQAEVVNDSGVSQVQPLSILRNTLKTTNARLIRDDETIVGRGHSDVLGEVTASDIEPDPP